MNNGERNDFEMQNGKRDEIFKREKLLKMEKGEWNKELLETYRITIDILEEIKKRTKFDYKSLASIELWDEKKHPTWHHRIVKIGYNNDPQSLAHEMAHGLHEKIREAGHEDKYGEKFADTIRYFVEKIISPTSNWLRNYDGNILLEECDYNFEKFIEKLNSPEFFSNIQWP